MQKPYASKAQININYFNSAGNCILITLLSAYNFKKVAFLHFNIGSLYKDYIFLIVLD